MGQWSEWGTCSRNNKTCGFKWGLETRTRQIVKKPAKDTIPCPTIAESRRCKMAMRHCPGGKPRPHHKNLWVFLNWNSISNLKKRAVSFQLKQKPCLLCQMRLNGSSTTADLICAARLEGKAWMGMISLSMDCETVFFLVYFFKEVAHQRNGTVCRLCCSLKTIVIVK